MELAAVNSPAAAFVAGLVTSLHCAGMCGPLACALLPVRRDQGDALTVGTAYHVARLGAYTLLGIVAGGLGRAPLSWISQSWLRWLPWLLVATFVALAFRWDRHLPRLPLLGGAMLRVRSWTQRRSRVQAAAALGLATPLLPCGPLYFLVALALLSGSAVRGAGFMLAFGLGTVPLLWFAQSRFGWLQARLTPRRFAQVRAVLALATAVVIAWRLRATLGLPGPDPTTFVCY